MTNKLVNNIWKYNKDMIKVVNGSIEGDRKYTTWKI